MLFDLVSDLHVDYWKDTGFEYDWAKSKKHNSVIICGDMSDDIDSTVHELITATKVYDNVLYVYGNHEASMFYDDLSQVSSLISRRMRGRSNFFNLSEQDFILDGVAFIGACGWWDFEMGAENDQTEDFKKKSIESFDVSWNKVDGLLKSQLVENIIREANKDFENLQERIQKQEKNKHKICLVTHTVPHRQLLHPKRYCAPSSMGHSRMHTLTSRDSVVCCVYGHDHNNELETQIDGKIFVNNARGRPSDKNRRDYFPLALFLD